MNAGEESAGEGKKQKAKGERQKVGRGLLPVDFHLLPFAVSDHHLPLPSPQVRP